MGIWAQTRWCHFPPRQGGLPRGFLAAACRHYGVLPSGPRQHHSQLRRGLVRAQRGSTAALAPSAGQRGPAPRRARTGPRCPSPTVGLAAGPAGSALNSALDSTSYLTEREAKPSRQNAPQRTGRRERRVLAPRGCCSRIYSLCRRTCRSHNPGRPPGPRLVSATWAAVGSGAVSKAAWARPGSPAGQGAVPAAAPPVRAPSHTPRLRFDPGQATYKNNQ